MSSFVPNWRQPVGQALMHAGSRPTDVRSTQSVHLAIFPVFELNLGTLKGHPDSQYLHPMHASGFTSTVPFSYCTMAPGAGHASRHPGSPQCMHWSLRKSHESAPLSCSRSSKRIRFQNCGWSSSSVWYVPTCFVGTGGRSFHSWQATSHALQPMQIDVSMYLATTGSVRFDVWLPHIWAEERRISAVWMLMAVLPSRLLELHEEALELRRPGVGVHRRSREEVRERADVAGAAVGVPPVERVADLPDLLSVGLERPEAFGDHRDALDRAARGGHLPHRAVRDAEGLRERFGDLDEEPGLELVQDLRVLGPVVVVLRQPVRGADDRELVPRAVDVLVVLERLGDR